MRKLLALVLIISLLSLGAMFMAGYGFAHGELKYQLWHPAVPELPIDIDTGLAYLERAKLSHQIFIDDPNLISRYGSTTEFQQGCVDRYNALQDLIIRLAQ